MITFGIFVLLAAFTFVFCLDALAIPNTDYGVLALIGYRRLHRRLALQRLHREAERRGPRGLVQQLRRVVSIVFVWYLTRCGTAFNGGNRLPRSERQDRRLPWEPAAFFIADLRSLAYWPAGAAGAAALLFAIDLQMTFLARIA